MIRCRVCHSKKHKSQFYKACINKSGGLGECKECTKERVRKNRVENAEYYREYDKKRFQDDPRVRARQKRYQATDAGKAAIKRCHTKWKERNPEKRAAHVALGNAIRRGDILKPEACQECGTKPKRIEGHHRDYRKPLDVVWLCRSCHVAEHKAMLA